MFIYKQLFLFLIIFVFGNNIDDMRKKDVQQALLLEEKIALQMKLMCMANDWNGTETDGAFSYNKDRLPDYACFMGDQIMNLEQLWLEVNKKFGLVDELIDQMNG